MGKGDNEEQGGEGEDKEEREEGEEEEGRGRGVVSIPRECPCFVDEQVYNQRQKLG